MGFAVIKNIQYIFKKQPLIISFLYFLIFASLVIIIFDILTSVPKMSKIYHKNAFLFQPPKASYSAQVRGKLVPEVNLICLDQQKGFYVVETPNEDGSQTCIVWAHGNACDCGEESGGYLHLARELKVVIIAVEFPGYGASPGIPSEKGVDDALEAAYAYAKSRNFNRILLGGRSVGTGPVCRLARRICSEPSPEFSGLILWSPIASVKESCANVAGVGVSSLLGVRWAPIMDLQFISRPVLFISAERDTLSPLMLSLRLQKSCLSTNVTFLHASETADHNENWDVVLDIVQPMRRFVEFVSKEDRQALDEEDQNDSELAIDGDHVLGGNLGDISADQQTKRTEVEQSPPTPCEAAEVVIIGCGPVGLWTACNLIHLGLPGNKILCVDKYATFQRSHVLRLDPLSVANAPESLQELIKDQLVGVTRTNEIETLLAEECKRKDVHFIRPFEVKDPKAFARTFAPNCRAIVCSDGSHSISRKQTFGGLERRLTLEYVLDCRGEIVSKDKPEKLSFASVVEMLGKTTHVGEESIGRRIERSKEGEEEKQEDNNESAAAESTTWPITFRVLITGAEMKQIQATKKATARHPLNVSTLALSTEENGVLPPTVHTTISTWVATRVAQFPNETISDLRCVAVDLNCYRAKKFVAIDVQDKVPMFLVGDAAFGVPFFRALNNGLICGSECAKTLLAELHPDYVADLFDRQNLRPESGPDIEGTDERFLPSDRTSFVTRSLGASTASMNLTSQISQIMAHASFERGVGFFIESRDPLRRYDDFVRRLSRKEFARAHSKRDGLEITKFANYLHNQARISMAAASTSVSTSSLSSSLPSSSHVVTV